MLLGGVFTGIGGLIGSPASAPAAAVRSLTFADGTYEGDVVAGQPHGKGVRRWTSGEDKGRVYMGDFKNGLREGRGKNSREGCVYEGEWKNDCFDGRGRYFYASGAFYEGDFRGDKMEGIGKFTWPNGNIYDGGWKNDKQEGRGKMTWADGRAYDGEWKEDKAEGRGTYTFASGSVYDGEWINDKREGNGMLRNALGKVIQQGRWENDVFAGGARGFVKSFCSCRRRVTAAPKNEEQVLTAAAVTF